MTTAGRCLGVPFQRLSYCGPRIHFAACQAVMHLTSRYECLDSELVHTRYLGMSALVLSFFFFRLLPLSLRHFRRMSPSALIRTRAVSDVEVAGSRVKTSLSLRRDTCRGGHVEAVFFSPGPELTHTRYLGVSALTLS